MDFYWKKEWTVPAVGAASFLAGALGGVLVTRRKYQIAIDDISEVAFATMQDLEVERENNAGLMSSIGALNDRLNEELKRNDQFRLGVVVPTVEHLEIVDPPESDEQGADRPFDNLGHWTPEDDEEQRAGDGPYILHEDEYARNEKDYRQVDLTWYEGDHILADDQNVPIYNPPKVVGQLIWGRGSSDPDVLYIRNDANKAEYMVSRNPGSYMSEVQGLEAEERAEQDDLKHSQRIPKFRPD